MRLLAKSSLLLLSLSVSTLAAQNQPGLKFTNGNSPTAGGGNAFPWGSCGLRYQQIIDGSVLAPTTPLCFIQDLFVTADASRGSRVIEHLDIEINMGPTTVTNATTSSAWDTNLPPANKTTVYRGPLTINHEANAWHGVGLPNPYRFLSLPNAPNLCIEIITWNIKGCTAPSNFYYPRSAVTSQGQERRAFRYDWINNQTQNALTGTGASRLGILCGDGNFVVAGTGCSGMTMSGQTTGWPQLNTPYTVSLSGASPNSIAVLFFGIPVAPPFDLGAIGAPGCMWYTNPIAIFGRTTSASGAASLTLPLPNLLGARAWMQWLNRNTSANTLGWTTSELGTLILGT